MPVWLLIRSQVSPGVVPTVQPSFTYSSQVIIYIICRALYLALSSPSIFLPSSLLYICEQQSLYPNYSKIPTAVLTFAPQQYFYWKSCFPFFIPLFCFVCCFVVLFFFKMCMWLTLRSVGFVGFSMDEYKKVFFYFECFSRNNSFFQFSCINTNIKICFQIFLIEAD